VRNLGNYADAEAEEGLTRSLQQQQAALDSFRQQRQQQQQASGVQHEHAVCVLGTAKVTGGNAESAATAAAGPGRMTGQRAKKVLSDRPGATVCKRLRPRK